ncbi:MAG: bifunctional transaldolase/phosoglucose isomerase [Thermoanaerobaculia bacterium]
MTNPLAQLSQAGQSVWFDQMERKLVTTGKLQQMIDEDDLRGLTSNPTIFEKAIGGSEDYDEQLATLASQNRTREEIYDELVIEDIASAADIFRPVYDRTNGHDGYVSLEVSPLLARDTERTVSEAKRLFARVGRPNVMIKIPATAEGLPAIEEAIASGINVNVTLIFSNEVYARVMEAYIRGLERRAEQGLPVGDIASVASFFISRIDAQADKEIEARIKETGDNELESLLGQVAIANAKLAYQEWKRVFGSERFLKLRDKGAAVQRPLWASTGTKSPKYSDVLYIETLIGPETVNTVPPATYAAFRDHGTVEATLEQDVEGAGRILAKFEEKGFSLAAITQKLEADGVRSFKESFDQLLATIEARRDAATRRLPERLTPHLGDCTACVEAASRKLEKEKVISRIWSRDTTVWKNDEAAKKIIANSLGWLGVADEMQQHTHRLVAFAEGVRKDFDHVAVLGMGGSSLCSEVLRRVFGKREGFPELLVLDSTVPEAVLALEAHVDLARTLFIVASKSGNTTEPVMFHRYFYDRVRSVKGDRAGENFVAITDPDTQLAADAKKDGFRHTFTNWSDIGGRYSALSFFGMVPAAIAGIDVVTLIERAAHAAHVSMLPGVRKNPAALLGTIIGELASQGHDKLTLMTPAPLDTLGLWIEQLVAESTGKEGKGIVPIAGEPLLEPRDYGNDRLFVSIRMKDSGVPDRLHDLAAAGHPVIDLVLEDALDLGEIFFVWEFATAVAGALMGVNPFDQPNVQESKDNTKLLIEEFKSSGTLSADGGTRAGVGDADVLAALLEQVESGDYVALTQYFAESHSRNERLAAVREAISRTFGVATTSGYGPRFLHSTGQLHKGGGDNGVFIQLTGGPKRDVEIQGEGLSFGVLARAQAIGDFQALVSRNRRAVSIDLGDDVEAGLDQLLTAVRAAVAAK